MRIWVCGQDGITQYCAECLSYESQKTCWREMEGRSPSSINKGLVAVEDIILLTSDTGLQ